MTYQKFIQILGLGILTQGSISIAQRPTPGANLGSSARSSSTESLSQDSDIAKLMIGDYVELDNSIKNEMYGTIDFPNAELKDIIKAISKLARKNFILDRKIENRRITILSPEPVTKQEAYNAFLSALYMNDLTLVSEGKFLKIVEVNKALQSNIRVFMGDYAPNTAEVITVLYPLKNLNAEEIQRQLTDLVPRSGRITAYPNTNTLVMTDTGFNLKRIISIVKSIDIPGHEDQLESITIQYASAKEIAKLVDEILNAQSGGSSTVRSRTSRNVQKTRGGGTITKIVPDERTNALIVLANGRGLVELKNLIRQLDTPNAAGGGNIHVYSCKNAVAEELAATINSLIGNQNNNRPNVPGGANITPINPPGIIRPIANQNRGDDGVRFDGNLKVTADKATNSLVVVGSAADYASLKKILQQLDVPRKQVYVEATIMEIKLDRLREFGMGINVAKDGIATAGGFRPSSPAINFASMATAPGALTGLVAGFTGKPNVTYTPITGGDPIQIPSAIALIKALVDFSQAQILHQPQILTSDNQEAEIKITQKIPVPSAATSYTGDNPTTQVTYSKENVEIYLKITPQLGDSDLLKLKVEQGIDDYQPAADNQISTTQRKATTTVVVRDGDTVVVGGLQKHSTADVRSRIPVLGDLPILGYLFGGTTARSEQSVLLLFMHPRIINDYSDLMDITGGKLKERIDLGSKASGPQDRLKDEVQKRIDENKKSAKRPAPKEWGFRPAANTQDNPESQNSAYLSQDVVAPAPTQIPPAQNPQNAQTIPEALMPLEEPLPEDLVQDYQPVPNASGPQTQDSAKAPPTNTSSGDKL